MDYSLNPKEKRQPCLFPFQMANLKTINFKFYIMIFHEPLETKTPDLSLIHLYMNSSRILLGYSVNIFCIFCEYFVKAQSHGLLYFRRNYSLLTLAICTVTFGRKLFAEIRNVRHGEIQGRSLVFFKAHCPCILPCLT